jgi:hypothetical protein
MEQQSNTAEATAETTPVETGETSDNAATKDLSTKAITDRIGAALEQATTNQPPLSEIAENTTVDNLTGVNLPEGEHKGIDYNKVVKDLPEDAQKMLANIRSSYTKKTQELAAQRRELEAAQAALVHEETFKKFSETADRHTELDPYDTESFNRRIEEEVSKRMRDMLAPMQEQYHLQQRKAKLDNWTAANPDYVDYKADIVTLLKTNKALDLQSAYYIVKGKASTTQAQELKAENKRYKTAAREYGLKIGAGNTVTANKPPKGLKSYELYNWLKANAEQGRKR